MIAAAAADGRIDANEQQQIIGGLQQAGIGAEAQAFLQQEIENPASVDDLAGACQLGRRKRCRSIRPRAWRSIRTRNAESAVPRPSSPQRLGIDAKLAAHIDATAQAAAA